MISEYYKNLPKKRMAAGALILNENDEVLIVKQSYKDYWSIAGGVVDENESPRDACIREAKEEIGIDLKETELLCVDYLLNGVGQGESLKFIFFGGKLNENEIKEIKVDGKEIVEYKFMKIENALPLLNERLKKRLPKALEALKNNAVIYLEDGEFL